MSASLGTMRFRSTRSWLVAVLAAVVAVLGLVAPSLPARAATGVFYVDPVADEVWGEGWPPGADVSVLVGAKKPVVVATCVVDATGAFSALDLSADIRAGEVVALDVAGQLTQPHTVTSVTVRSIDVASDTLRGTAERGSWVRVGLLGAGHVDVQASKSGAWVAELDPVGVDLTTGMRGYAAQYDPDPASAHAATWITWQSYNPAFRVEPSPEGYWVWSPTVGDRLGTGYEWPAYTDLTVVLDPVDGVRDVLTVTTDKNGAFATFDGSPLGAGSSPGDVVTVTDGTVGADGSITGATVVKDHVVTALTLDLPINTVADRVSGGAAPGSQVYVQPTLADGTNGRLVTATDDGIWAVDYAGTFDIAPMSMGYVAQADDDGDATHIGWHAWVPNFSVDPANDTVQGPWWGDSETPEEPPHTVVTVEIEGDSGSPRFAVADGPEDSFVLDVSGYDLRAGDVVRVSNPQLDGEQNPVWGTETVVKEHTVLPLMVTTIDHTADTVTGSAATGTAVGILACDFPTCTGRDALPATSPPKLAGSWSSDFSLPQADAYGTEPPFDLRLTTRITVSQADDDNDSTIVVRPGQPVIYVDPVYNAVWGTGWPEGVEVEIAVHGRTYLATVDESGWFLCEVDPAEVDLLPGDVVTVTGGGTARSTVVSPLAVTGVDLTTDVVSGAASPSENRLMVGVWLSDEWYEALLVETDSQGAWSVDLSEVGDLTEESHVGVYDPDEDGDFTTLDWFATAPPVPVTFTDPLQDLVWGFDWQPATAISVTVDGGEPLLVTSDETGWFEITVPTDVTAGSVVSVSDGSTEKVHAVTDLAVTAVDTELDLVTGSTSAADGLSVGVWDVDGQSAAALDVAVGIVWTADFAGVYDLVPGTSGYAGQADDDGDSTWIGWTAG